jgi:hypothetical protein
MAKALFRSSPSRFILLVSLLGLAGCGGFSSKDPKSAAEAFFGLVGKGNTSAAYNSAAFVFQAQQSLQSFEVTVKELGLADFQSIGWTRSVIKESEAKLDVEIVRKNGGKVPVEVTLIKESGLWKVYALHTTSKSADALPENRFSVVGRSAAFNQVFKQSLPPENEIKDLVRESMLKFNTAIKKNNFDGFYEYIAHAWQAQVLENRLERAFDGFHETGIDISSVRDAPIVFDEPPIINNDGLLLVDGHFQVPPYQVVFSLKYTYELPRWRLFGIDVNCLK